MEEDLEKEFEDYLVREKLLSGLEVNKKDILVERIDEVVELIFGDLKKQNSNERIEDLKFK